VEAHNSLAAAAPCAAIPTVLVLEAVQMLSVVDVVTYRPLAFLQGVALEVRTVLVVVEEA
jgi:hypothetical protein